MTIIDDLWHYYAHQNIMLQLGQRIRLHLNDSYLFDTWGLTSQYIGQNRQGHEMCTWLSRDPRDGKLCILHLPQPLLSYGTETFEGIEEVRSRIQYHACIKPEQEYTGEQATAINLIVPDPRQADSCAAWLRRIREVVYARR